MTRPLALLATLRIANAPSVASNVFLGGLLGKALWAGWAPSVEDARIGWNILSGLLLYFAGNFANDWFDRDWDRQRRPERALPAGLFSPQTYFLGAVLCALSGALLAFHVGTASGLCAIAILILITVYTWLHKHTTWAVIPMGLCRAGLYFLGAFAYWPEWEFMQRSGFEGTSGTVGFLGLGVLALGLFSYIAGLSLSARCESVAEVSRGSRALSVALLLVPVLAMPFPFMADHPRIGWIGIPPYLLWLALSFTRYRKSVPSHVSALLAGIPLLDLMAIAPVGMISRQSSGIPESIGLLVAVPLAAFVLGRLLQRLAPAT